MGTYLEIISWFMVFGLFVAFGLLLAAWTIIFLDNIY
jgi:hypothetical protein